jgi:hypothetical protein
VVGKKDSLMTCGAALTTAAAACAEATHLRDEIPLHGITDSAQWNTRVEPGNLFSVLRCELISVAIA